METIAFVKPANAQPDAKEGSWCRVDWSKMAELIRIAMKIVHRQRRLLARFAIGLLLFAQAIGIVQACVDADAKPAMAFTEPMRGCNEESGTTANACLQHCTSGDQSTAQVYAGIAEMPRVAAWYLPVVTTASNRPVARCSSRSTDPPPSIRFCSFQL
jgi:hypothetical protein